MLKNPAKSRTNVFRPALVLLRAFLIFGSVILAFQAIRTAPRKILRLLVKPLNHGGRLVGVDRSDFDHPAFPDTEESDLRAPGLEIVMLDHRFIVQPANEGNEGKRGLSPLSL